MFSWDSVHLKNASGYLMDSDARTAQQIYQRYQDTSLVIFLEAQNRLKQEQACKSVSNFDLPEGEADASYKYRFLNLFRRRSNSKTTQSAVCIVL